MYIKKISDYDGYTANVIVTDGTYNLICFYCGYTNGLDKEIHENIEVKEISAMFSKNIMRINKSEYLIQKKYGKGEHFAYYLQGKVLDLTTPLIGIGKLTVELDSPLPKDIAQDEFIEFSVDRLDCFLD
ncbi:MAG: hypothetical protein LBN07_00335 [Christensenellaceae bacterium]|jgi:hypothetical protein|nr:hypothetical protein [Christensenellaceae bacterium]